MPTHVSALPSPVTESPRRLPALIVLLVALFGSLLVSTATPADATTPGSAYIQEASRHNGQPYVYGAMGPTKFDCSGFTKYVFSRFGKSLPHNAAGQRSATQAVSRSSMRIGDLVFLDGAGHVGIYAGNGNMWDAPRTGENVTLRKIYSTRYSVGRVASA